MRSIHQRLTMPALLALALAACGSGGIGDILGGGDDTIYDGDRIVEVRGVVESVDERNRIIVVDARDTTTALRNAGDRLALYYEPGTPVEYEGRTFEPEDLEPGDEILARVDEVGNRLEVEDIEVLYDVTGGYDTRDPEDDDRYADYDLRGTVRRVDVEDRVLQLERARYGSGFSTGGGDVVTLYWDGATRVEFEGRTYSPQNLEVGDVVDVEVRDLGDRLLAEEIVVVEDVRATY